MMNPSRRYMVLLVCLAAGTASSLVAQPVPAEPRRAQPAARADDRNWAPHYRSWKWLDDRDVYDGAGKEIAEVKDIIIERGTGKIEYVVLDTNRRAKANGKTLAVPFDTLAFSDKDKLTIRLTSDQLATEPVFRADAWKEGAKVKAADRNALDQQLIAQSATAAVDPYAGKLDNIEPKRIEGTVQKVERTSNRQYGEQVVLTVMTDDRSELKVALGPSWYVNSGEGVPARGDKISLNAYAIPNDSDSMYVASSATMNGKDIQFRDKASKPLWSLRSESATEDSQAPMNRYVLGSWLQGAKVDCRGEACGKVNDLVVESRSGRIAFLSIDPNKNFLGIADTKRLVPWTIASVWNKGTVRLDASKDMILASTETPKDFTTLTSEEHFDKVYSAYQIDRPMHEKRTMPGDHDAMESHALWFQNGSVLKNMDRAKSETLTGTCDGMANTTINREVGDAKIIRIKTAQGLREVIVGPSWYTPKDEVPCGTNAPVTIEAWSAMINGKQYWIARSIDTKGTRTEMFDTSGSPIWQNK